MCAVVKRLDTRAASGYIKNPVIPGCRKTAPGSGYMARGLQVEGRKGAALEYGTIWQRKIRARRGGRVLRVARFDVYWAPCKPYFIECWKNRSGVYDFGFVLRFFWLGLAARWNWGAK